MDDKLIWNIPSEYDLDRLEELKDFIENFPGSPLVPIMQKEIEQIKERNFL